MLHVFPPVPARHGPFPHILHGSYTLPHLVAFIHAVHTTPLLAPRPHLCHAGLLSRCILAVPEAYKFMTTRPHDERTNALILTHDLDEHTQYCDGSMRMHGHTPMQVFPICTLRAIQEKACN